MGSMKTAKIALLALLVVGSAGAAGTSASPGFNASRAVERAASNAGGAIVFASNRDGDYDIYGVNRDGTGLTQLTNDPLDESGPLPSPDGRRILFYGGEEA